MPSDVSMHPSSLAQQHRSQKQSSKPQQQQQQHQLITSVHSAAAKTTSGDDDDDIDTSSSDGSIYEQRYHALRAAGFEHETASKYAAMYSSVTEVIDNILSQSLIQQLAIEKGNNNSNGSDASAAACKASAFEALLSGGQHHHLATTTTTAALDSANLKSIYDAEALCSLLSHNGRVQPQHQQQSENDCGIIQCRSTANNADLMGADRSGSANKNGVNQLSIMRHLQENDHLEIAADKRSSEGTTNYFKNGSFVEMTDCAAAAGHYRKGSLHEQECEEARLSAELLGLNFFSNRELDQLKSISDLVKSHSSVDHSEQYGKEDSYGKARPYFDEDCLNGAFNRNLLVTVLKDGLFDPDEANLEDEGVGGEQNMASTASSSASLSSSGASSLLLDSSSSPSSFSSLSSSISTTPPDALNCFETGALEPSLGGNPLFAFHHSSSSKFIEEGKLSYGDLLADKQMNSCSEMLTCNGDDKFDAIDLTREAVNGTLNGFDSAASYEHAGCPHDMNSGGGHSASVSSQKNHHFHHYHSDYKYAGENIFAFSAGNSTDSSELLFDGNGPSHHQSSANSHHFSGGFEKLHNNHQFSQSADGALSENIFVKPLSMEDSEYSPYAPTARHNSLFDYSEQQTTTHASDSFGFPLDKLNKSGGQTADLFGDYASFRHEAFFGSPSTNDSSELHCSTNQSQSSYSNGFLNSRTFADIAASNVISSGNKLVDDAESCLGAIGDCKSPKSNSLSCSNLNINNLNAGYFNLFTNGANGNNHLPSAQNVTSFYDQSTGQTLAKQKTNSFCGQANNAFHASLSPISGNSNKNMYGNGTLNMGEQMNFSQQSSMRANLSMLSSGLNGNNGHGQIGQATADMIGLSSPSCDGMMGSGVDHKPTNIMAYKGLWVCNISPDVTLAYLKRRFRRFGHFTGIQTFERRATNGSNIVFVHYDNPYSPVEAIACLHNYTGQDLCADPVEPLKLRFAPSMEQSRAGQLPTLEQARKLVERHGECFNWRLSSGCHRGIRCQLKHVPINKEIDSQPWVKALKKKNSDM